MSPLKFLVVTLLAIAVAFGLVAGAAVAYGRDAVWEQLFGPPDLGHYDFDHAARTGKLNDSLACPADAAPCLAAGMGRITPVFAVDGPTLLAAARGVLQALPSATVVEDLPAALSFRMVVRTPILRFPDTVSVQVRETAPGQSAIWIYSRSQIGHTDLGTNERRIRSVLRQLRRTLPLVPTPAG